MKTFEVTIKGVSPGILMHRFPEMTEADLQNSVKPRTRGRGTREEEAESVAYRLETGELYHPAEHIYGAMVRAAGDFQIQGRGKKTYRDLVKGSVIVAPEQIVHNTNDYDIDSRPVVIQRARVIRHRPLLRDWELSFELSALDEGLPVEVLNAIVVRAGEQFGIGDYRPRFGRFIVTRFQ